MKKYNFKRIEMIEDKIPCSVGEYTAEEIGYIEFDIAIVPILYAEKNCFGDFIYVTFSLENEPMYVLCGRNKDLMVENGTFKTALYHEIGHICAGHSEKLVSGIRDYALECEADDFAVRELGKEEVSNALILMLSFPQDNNSRNEVINRISRLHK